MTANLMEHQSVDRRAALLVCLRVGKKAELRVALLAFELAYLTAD